jgi:anti-sigma factor RsiW
MTMPCRDVRDLADAFVAGELLVETRQEIQRHLDTCPECRVEFERRAGLRAAVQRAFLTSSELAAPLDLKTSIARSLRPAPAAPRPSLVYRYPWLATAAAVVLVSAAVFGAAMGLDTSHLVALARDAWGDHRNCAVAFHLNERPISLEEASWNFDAAFARLASVPGAVISTPGGDALVTERHSCVFAGHRYAHIVLKFKGELVSLLVAQEETDAVAFGVRGVTMANLRVRVLSVDGAQAAVFRASDHLGFVVGNLPESDLLDLATALAAPVGAVLAG